MKPVVQQAATYSSRPDTTARGGVYLSGAQALVALLGYAVHVFAARSFSKADYGQFVLLLSLITWVTTLQTVIVLPGLFKIVSEDRRRIDAALEFAKKWYASFNVLLLVSVLAAAPFLARAFDDATLFYLLLLAALQIPFLAIQSVGRTQLGAIRQYRQSAAVTSVYATVRAICACGLIWLGFGVGGAIAGQICGSLVASILAVTLLWKARRDIPSVSYPSMTRRTVSWTLLAAPVTMLFATVTSLDLWFVNRLLAESDAGLYGTAFTVSRLPYFLVIGLTGAVMPRVSAALSDGISDLARDVSLQAMRYLMLLFIPMCGIVASSAKEILGLLFSTQYEAAGLVLAMLMVAVSLCSAVWLLATLLASADRPGIRLILIATLLPISLVLNALLVPIYGMTGAAAASIIVHAFGTVAGVLLVFHVMRIMPPILNLIRCCAAGGLVFLIGSSWPVSGWLLLVKLSLLALTYLLLLVLFRELLQSDFNRIMRAIWK